MATLTVEFTGVLNDILNEIVNRGMAKTKAEALRLTLLHYGEELGLVKQRLHMKAEEYAYQEIKERLKRTNVLRH